MIRTVPLVFLLAACSSGTQDRAEEHIADYESAVAAAQALTTDHVATVAAATTMEEVPTLEATYVSDWDTMHADMTAAMDMLEKCDMDDEGMGIMDEADTSMADAEAAVMDHMSGHDTHADLAACVTDEDAHAVTMTEHLDAMMAHGDEWRGNTHCDEKMGGM